MSQLVSQSPEPAACGGGTTSSASSKQWLPGSPACSDYQVIKRGVDLLLACLPDPPPSHWYCFVLPLNPVWECQLPSDPRALQEVMEPPGDAMQVQQSIERPSIYPSMCLSVCLSVKNCLHNNKRTMSKKLSDGHAQRSPMRGVFKPPHLVLGGWHRTARQCWQRRGALWLTHRTHTGRARANRLRPSWKRGFGKGLKPQ